MSVNTTAELDALILKATSESIPNGELDLPSALEISDVVRSRRVSPKECMRCLKRRIMATTTNPNTQIASWKLTEICIKNGGIPFIKEICSREFMDTMENTIIKSNKDRELQELVSRMFYELYVAFRNDSQLNYVARVHDKLVGHGIEFPSAASVAEGASAMFDSRTPADWVESDACMICSKSFSFLNRRHHCRSCGGIFCQDHSSNSTALPDLGIYEPVRVCDNCFEDYSLKKGTGTSKKKRHGRKSRRRAESESAQGYEDEELSEDLKKAIELSLKESKGNVEPIIPVMEARDQRTARSAPEDEDEDDAQLKAAIEASLREADEEKKRRELALFQQENYTSSYATQTQGSIPSYEITSAEEEDIHLFASLVERMKTQSPAEILEDKQLQTLYQKVIGTRPKLNSALNDAVHKYNMLIDMNTKISEIMNIYDELLERQLQKINLSERYSLPQVPSDPYSYYQNQPPALSSNYQREKQYAPAQSYQVEGAGKAAPYPPQQSAPYQVDGIQNQQRQQQPQILVGQDQRQQQQSYQLNQQSEAQSQAAVQGGQTKEYDGQPVGLQGQSDSKSSSLANMPSEPPYPTAEYEDQNTQQVPAQGQSHRKSGEESLQRRKLSNGTPYPLEDEETNTSQLKSGITNFDFPTVPTQKVLNSEQSLPQVETAIQNEEPSQPDEPLLIEL